MLFILGWLLNAFVLGLFGFDTMFINGMMEVFGVAITQTGYYFVFALIGIVQSSFFKMSGGRLQFGNSNKDKKADVQ